MSESIHFTIAQLAADLVEARELRCALKRERNSHVCEFESKPDYSIGDSGEPACWWSAKWPDHDPEDACDNCKKRAQIQPRLEAASKAATKAWTALKRAVNKAKKTEP